MEEVEMLGHVAELNELPYVSAFIEALVDAPCVCVCLGREVQEQEISCFSKLKFMDTGPYCHPSLFLLPEKHSGSVMSAAGVDIKQDCNANTQRGSVRGALGGGWCSLQAADRRTESKEMGQMLKTAQEGIEVI